MAVFADDCGAGYEPSIRKEYLALRAEYGKLIKIDSPGPDLTVPVTMLTGIDCDFDYDAGTVAISQRTYISGLEKKYAGNVTMNSMPYPPSQAKRERFEQMEKGTEETSVNPAQYLEGLGQVGWVTVISFPELAFTHSTLGTHMRYPTREAHAALLYALGYVINNKNSAIVYGGKLKTPMGMAAKPQYFDESYGLYVVHDSSWGKRPRPQSGHAVMRCNAAMFWSSRPLKVICDSTAHAESAEMARALKSVTFARTLHEDSNRPVMGPSASIGDNSACYELVQKEGSSQLTRHFERAIAAVKYAVQMLMIAPVLVTTNMMIADVFTKAVEEEIFHRCKHALRNTNRESYITGKISRLMAALARARAESAATEHPCGPEGALAPGHRRSRM